LLCKVLSLLSLVITALSVTNGITTSLFTNAFAQTQRNQTQEQKQLQGQAGQTSSTLKGQSGLQGSFFGQNNTTSTK
jgi:hypothetical protein